MPAPFADDAELLAAELAALDLVLLREAVRVRRAAGHETSERGLYISDDELRELLARPFAAPLWERVPVDGALAELGAAAATSRAEIDARLAATRDAGRVLRLEQLVAAHAEACAPLPLRQLLLLTLAPEFDLRYERIFGWLHDDITRRHPSVQLALELFAPEPAARLALLPALTAAGPLRRLGLVQLRPHAAGDPLLRHALRLAPGLLTWLSGHVSIDSSVHACVERREPDPALPGALALTPPLAAALARWRDAAAAGARLAINLHGRDGVGRRSLAAALCGALGRPLLVVDGARAATLSDEEHHDLLAMIARAARLERAAIAWVLADNQRPFLAPLAPADLLFVIAAGPWHPEAPPPGIAAIAELHVPVPDLPIREALWQAVLPDSSAGPRRAAADNFRFTPRQILAAAVTARGLADGRGATTPDQGDLLLACRRHATPKLGALAAPISTPHHWDDLVLPAEHAAQLRDLVRRVQQRSTVLDRWGFGLTGTRGLAALFAGAPGTGKTMAAGIVARACARDLYRIDLSQVVSKYIGETEKHLEQLFAEAEAADVALFFDEADAIFGKRGAIRDAHDRFANIEVGFLLQRIERFPGLVILASNLRKNIDAAFLRRLQVIVEFPAPDVASRARIWRQVWPAAAPVDPGVDPVLLAERFDLSGGHIRNIALAAAYAAAHEGATISLRHVLDAARAEYRKLDKLVREDSFADAPTTANSPR
ncbi:MAG: ATP-binding protein [Nannocystis sp.]|uniref:ATP-binding protein n=1 Tax=Nannocystis sp. TaxID=1962667 RepID=UPI002420B4BD|nr:ATP-binding protein [Nannocystis sp.]MBK9756188.1 ATP-binding protein [Nannocystis sp.]